MGPSLTHQHSSSWFLLAVIMTCFFKTFFTLIFGSTLQDLNLEQNDKWHFPYNWDNILNCTLQQVNWLPERITGLEITSSNLNARGCKIENLNIAHGLSHFPKVVTHAHISSRSKFHKCEPITMNTRWSWQCCPWDRQLIIRISTV